ncbi:hypothetical protein AWM75_07890 [Aerococcus urinaehominis]|uniref:Uncharacterized protein n=1 Tax=Aerococcus urinaehominis TaxID=128944 RepID=A0A120IB23_9LACT|nr:PTS sugar transporter subunit IIA [Aerococcus urinaehominis]AMB99893.1 hypothetical protein AWM75_07890 [Aerococcus urinaehominis]SDM52791.1 Transcriptional antiterminator [Aerococcus urinaehominis]
MNNRQLKLLHLLVHEHSYQPASYYADKMLVSARTIYSDLEVINDSILKYGSEIKRKPSFGIKLVGNHSIFDQIDVDRHVRQSFYQPSNRRLILIKSLAFTEQLITLENLSEKFIVSKTSIYNDIHIINEIIGTADVLIESSKEGVQLLGREENIQKAVKSVIFNFSNNESELSFDSVLDILFSRDEVNCMGKILKNEFDGFATNAADYYYRSLISILLIHLNRAKLGCHIEDQEELLLDSIRYMEAFPIAENLILNLSRQFNLSYSLSDKKYITKQLYAHRIQKNIPNSNEQIEESVDNLIHQLSRIEQVDLESDDYLKMSLYQHFSPMLLRLERGIFIENPLLESIKNQYMELFSILWYLMGDFEKKFNVSLNDHEISLILIHFQVALEKNAKSKNILIICQYGMSSAQLIYQKVKKILPSKDNIEIANLDKIHKVDLNNVDLIISTIDLGDLKKTYIKVSPIFSSEDYQKILQSYSLLLTNQSEIVDAERIKAPTVLKFLKSDLINLKIDANSKEEVLDFMISQLEEKQSVSTFFRKSIFDREKLGTTNLENKIAIPHANPNSVINSSISITTLKKPINWGKGKVQLVIMITLNDKDASNIKQIIEELLPLINSKKMVNDLILELEEEKWINRFTD